jgi:hypothetical protein
MFSKHIICMKTARYWKVIAMLAIRFAWIFLYMYACLYVSLYVCMYVFVCLLQCEPEWFKFSITGSKIHFSSSKLQGKSRQPEFVILITLNVIREVHSLLTVMLILLQKIYM